MEKTFNLNGNPEDQIPLREDQLYLASSGITSIEIFHETPTFVNSEMKANNIVFFAGQNNEMMRISPEGFFWKGKLVEEDHEIYLKVKEFFNTVKL